MRAALLLLAVAAGCAAPDETAPRTFAELDPELSAGVFLAEAFGEYDPFPTIRDPIVLPPHVMETLTSARATARGAWRQTLARANASAPRPREESRSAGTVNLWGVTWTATSTVTWPDSEWPHEDDTAEWGAQQLRLDAPGHASVVYRSPLDSPYASADLWDWDPTSDWRTLSRPFVDLNGDGVLDFGFVAEYYKTPYVEIWLSGPDGRHLPVETHLGSPRTAGGRVAAVEYSREGDWWATVYDFSRSETPLSSRRYGIAPNTTDVDGRVLLYVYEQPDKVYETLANHRLPPPPDAYVVARDLPEIEWGYWEPQDSLGRIQRDLDREVDLLTTQLSLVVQHQRDVRNGRFAMRRELLLLDSARERARLAAGVLK